MNQIIKIKSLFIIGLLSIFSSCKEEEVTDYRNDFIGTYELKKNNVRDIRYCADTSSPFGFCANLNHEQILQHELAIDNLIGNKLKIEKDPYTAGLLALDHTVWINYDRTIRVDTDLDNPPSIIIDFHTSDELEIRAHINIKDTTDSIISKIITVYSGEKL